MRKPIIVVENLAKTFGGITVLDDINMQINEGEMVAIVGESGCGKTTLLNILGLISLPTSGSYTIKGKNIRNINTKDAMLLRRHTIGYLFQNYGLVEDETVEWNLKLAYAYKKTNKKLQRKEMENLLNEFQLADKLKNKVYQLSGGEQQILALIKLMIKDCEISLADEPTGSLDETNRDLVIHKLIDMNKHNKTIIIVTHDMHVAHSCQRIIKLRKTKNNFTKERSNSRYQKNHPYFV